MARRTGREDRSAKAKRLASLRQRRRKHSAHFEALDRRQRAQTARLHAVRRRVAPVSSGVATAAVLERRRSEYVDVRLTVPSIAAPRAALASIAVAFALPVVVALVANFMPLLSPGAFAARHIAPARKLAIFHNAGHARLRPIGVRAPRRIAATRQTTIGNTTARHVALAVPGPGSNVVRRAVPVQPRLALAVPQAQPHSRAAASQVLSPSSVQTASPVQPKTALIARITSAWHLSADGTWVAQVHAPAGARDASFTASTGQLIALEPSAIDGQAATVTIGWSRPVSVSIDAGGQTRSVDLPAPDDSAEAFAAVAAGVGPHLINVGWTPLAQDAGVADYQVYRTATGAGAPALVARISPLKHSWRDSDVASGTAYSYDVVADTATGAIEANTLAVRSADELPSAPPGALAGKGMFLYFSSLAADPRYFGHYHPETVIAEARRAGIRVIELRMARGSCVMAQTQGARAWLDRLIDTAARSDIRLVAWTVPRRVTTQDLAQTLAAAAYRTPNGNGFVGLALDLETGDRYMGYGHKAIAGMVRYIQTVRAATGSHYLIVATVASPEMGNHTNADYPYAKIAAYADVLQPMEYWHYFDESSHHEYARREVAGASAAAVARTRELAGRDIPVNVAGQSVALEGTGSPSGREIQWSMGGAKSAGGIGETFFDWAGTRPDAWAAIQAFDW